MQSEDDNVLVKGVSGDKDSLAFFGYVYYKENAEKLKIVPVSYKGESASPPMRRRSTTAPTSPFQTDLHLRQQCCCSP